MKFIHFLGTFYNVDHIQLIDISDNSIQFKLTNEDNTYCSNLYTDEDKEALLNDIQSLM